MCPQSCVLSPCCTHTWAQHGTGHVLGLPSPVGSQHQPWGGAGSSSRSSKLCSTTRGRSRKVNVNIYLVCLFVYSYCSRSCRAPGCTLAWVAPLGRGPRAPGRTGPGSILRCGHNPAAASCLCGRIHSGTLPGFVGQKLGKRAVPLAPGGQAGLAGCPPPASAPAPC